MIDITVNLSAALLCVGINCYNVLIGSDKTPTPVGTFEIEKKLTSAPFYGGSILVFKENEEFAWSIHKVWVGEPSEKREWRIQQSDPNVRKISNGCINVSNSLYNYLEKYCATSCKITIY